MRARCRGGSRPSSQSMTFSERVEVSAGRVLGARGAGGVRGRANEGIAAASFAGAAFASVAALRAAAAGLAVGGVRVAGGAPFRSSVAIGAGVAARGAAMFACGRSTGADSVRCAGRVAGSAVAVFGMGPSGFAGRTGMDAESSRAMTLDGDGDGDGGVGVGVARTSCAAPSFTSRGGTSGGAPTARAGVAAGAGARVEGGEGGRICGVSFARGCLASIGDCAKSPWPTTLDDDGATAGSVRTSRGASFFASGGGTTGGAATARTDGVTGVGARTEGVEGVGSGGISSARAPATSGDNGSTVSNASMVPASSIDAFLRVRRGALGFASPGAAFGFGAARRGGAAESVVAAAFGAARRRTGFAGAPSPVAGASASAALRRRRGFGCSVSSIREV